MNAFHCVNCNVRHLEFQGAAPGFVRFFDQKPGTDDDVRDTGHYDVRLSRWVKFMDESFGAVLFYGFLAGNLNWSRACWKPDFS